MSEQIKAILLISSPDRKGLVYKLTEFIYQNQGNILHAEQHIDPESNYFFMRIEWDLHDFLIPSEKILEALANLKTEYNLKIKLHFLPQPTKTAIFASQNEHCLYDLLLKRKELNLDIRLIISNHEHIKQIAEYFNINFYHFPIFNENKSSVEETQLKLLAENQIELIVLARYMQILSPAFIQNYPHRIINVHHSFLPAFVGANPYQQAYARGVKLIGSTAHYVTTTLDDGPIIQQKVLEVSHKDCLDELKRKGKELEKLVLAEAVKKHTEHKVLVFNNKTVVFD